MATLRAPGAHAAHRGRRRRRGEHGRSVLRLYQGRDRQVGQGHQGRQHPRRVTPRIKTISHREHRDHRETPKAVIVAGAFEPGPAPRSEQIGELLETNSALVKLARQTG